MQEVGETIRRVEAAARAREDARVDRAAQNRGARDQLREKIRRRDAEVRARVPRALRDLDLHGEDRDGPKSAQWASPSAADRRPRRAKPQRPLLPSEQRYAAQEGGRGDDGGSDSSEGLSLRKPKFDPRANLPEPDPPWATYYKETESTLVSVGLRKLEIPEESGLGPFCASRTVRIYVDCGPRSTTVLSYYDVKVLLQVTVGQILAELVRLVGSADLQLFLRTRPSGHAMPLRKCDDVLETVHEWKSLSNRGWPRFYVTSLSPSMTEPDHD